MIQLKNLTKVYKTRSEMVVALKDINLDIQDKTGLVFLLGKSGSGKTTLLNCLAGLDNCDGGQLWINGRYVNAMSGTQLDDLRNHTVGFVFQDYATIDELTVGQNIELALKIQGVKDTKEQVQQVLDKIELQGYANRKIRELSGGQKQRVAIARALVKRCQVLLADEPTGNLDSETSQGIFKLLQELSKTQVVIVVTHDRDNAHEYGDRIVELKDGKIHSDEVRRQVQQGLDQNYTTATPNKSHLPISFALRLGGKLLLRKKIRLAFSIVLPIVILAVFGLIVVGNTTNTTDLVLRELYDAGVSKVMLSNNRVNYVDGEAIILPTNEQAYPQQVLNRMLDTRATAMVWQDLYDPGFGNWSGRKLFEYNFDNRLNYIWGGNVDEIYTKVLRPSYQGYYGNYFGSYQLVVQSDTQPKDIGKGMLCGTLPQDDTEIAITEATYLAYKVYGYKQGETIIEPKDISNPDDVLDLYINYDQYQGDDKVKTKQLKIVGVLQTEINPHNVFDKLSVIWDKLPSNRKLDLHDIYNNNLTLNNMSVVHNDFYQQHQYNEINNTDSPIMSVVVSLSGNTRQDRALFERYSDISSGNDYVMLVRSPQDYYYYYVVVSYRVVYKIMTGIMIGAFVFACLLICNFVFASIKASKKLIGILRSMGLRGRDVGVIFGVETGFVVVLVSIFSFLCTMLTCYLINQMWHVNVLRPNLGHFGILILVTLAVNAILMAIPMVYLIKQKPIKVIRAD